MLILLFGSGSAAFAKELTPMEVIREMNKRYINASSFSMNIQVDIYDNTNSSNAAQTFKGSACKRKENYFSKMMGQTTIVNERCLLLVDDDNKVIQYEKKENSNDSHLKGMDIFSLLDSLPKNFKSIQFAEESVDRYYIRFESLDTDPAYKNFTIEVDKNNFTFMGITYVMKNEEDSPYDKIAIHYTDTKFDAPLADDVFSETKYIIKSKGKVAPSPAFSKYRLINKEDYKANLN